MESLQAPADARKIMQDNEVLMDKLAKNAGIPPTDAEAAMTEVIRFLELVAGSKGETLTPSLLVDNAWHEFILCTRAYCQFCDKRFGRYLHHHPGAKSDKHSEQFSRTLEIYEERYGPPPPRFWGMRTSPHVEAPDCGSCESTD